VERIRVRIDRRADRRAWAALGAAPFEFYDPVDDWQARLHESIGEPWPCAAASRFDEVWAELEALFASSGLRRRRASYGGWDDADPYFARGVWCAVAHRQPAVVVETGVAHGVTTRVVLEALAEQREGALWSIDLPAVDPALHHQIAVAVPQDLRTRWTYVPGTSRERLRALIVGLGQVGVFIHDSLHTGRNTRFSWKGYGRRSRRVALPSSTTSITARLSMLSHVPMTTRASSPRFSMMASDCAARRSSTGTDVTGVARAPARRAVATRVAAARVRRHQRMEQQVVAVMADAIAALAPDGRTLLEIDANDGLQTLQFRDRARTVPGRLDLRSRGPSSAGGRPRYDVRARRCRDGSISRRRQRLRRHRVANRARDPQGRRRTSR
jgi:hypothetical protein